MRIIIVGLGEIGAYLAQILALEKHDVGGHRYRSGPAAPNRRNP